MKKFPFSFLAVLAGVLAAGTAFSFSHAVPSRYVIKANANHSVSNSDGIGNTEAETLLDENEVGFNFDTYVAENVLCQHPSTLQCVVYYDRTTNTVIDQVWGYYEP